MSRLTAVYSAHERGCLPIRELIKPFPFHDSVRSSIESVNVTLCGLPARPYLVAMHPRLSIAMPSSAVGER
jgi:hypothetical protein